MKRTLTAIAAALSVAALAAPATATVNARQLNQERNIDAGVRSGKLTPREAANLRGEVRAIERQYNHFRRDGRYTQHEKDIIHSRQAALSTKIDRLKHNGRRAG